MSLGICNTPYTFHHTRAIWIKQHPHVILVSTQYLDYEVFHVYSSNASVFTAMLQDIKLATTSVTWVL